MNKTRSPRPAVSNLHLAVYLFAILVWEAQVGVLLLRWLGGVPIPIWARGITLVLSVTLSILVLRIGRDDFRRLIQSRGRLELTSLQMVMVTLAIVAFGATAGLAFKAYVDAN